MYASWRELRFRIRNHRRTRLAQTVFRKRTFLFVRACTSYQRIRFKRPCFIHEPTFFRQTSPNPLLGLHDRSQKHTGSSGIPSTAPRKRQKENDSSLCLYAKNAPHPPIHRRPSEAVQTRFFKKSHQFHLTFDTLSYQVLFAFFSPRLPASKRSRTQPSLMPCPPAGISRA